jgi:C4-dicarboxylate-specific signal transduction histidine kinase
MGMLRTGIDVICEMPWRKRRGSWDFIETAGLKQAKEEIKRLNEELERRMIERTNQLALASEVLREAQSALAHVNRVSTMGQLVATIAHEINQPLTAITLAASTARRWLALSEPNIEEVRGKLDQIENAGHRAGEIITSLRGMLKKETQARSPIDINNLVFTVLAIVRHELQEHQIELRTELDESLPSLEGDRVQLQQVVLNLVMNAIEAMQSVAPRILKIRSGISKPDVICVSIEDTGTGVDPSDRDHIFKPMFTTKERGMGLGLSICHCIIESHNGRIWATQGIDKGSIFQFELPAKAAQGNQVRQRQA